MQRLPAGLALHRTLLRGRGGLCGWWHRHRDYPIGQQHGLLALQGIDGIEGLGIRSEDLIQSFPQILQQMKAVRHLDGCGCALACTLRIRTRPIPSDDLHPGMFLEPLGDSLSGTIRQECHGLPVLQVHQDRAIGVPFPQGEIVHPEHPGRGQSGQRQLPEQAQESVPAHHHVPLVAKLHPSCAPQGHAEGAQALGQPQGAPGPGSGHRGQAFGEDTATAGTIAAKPLADAQLQVHPILCPGQVRQGAPIITMDASRWSGAQRTGGAGLRRLHAQGDLCRGVVDVTRRKAQARGIR
jgi:hypothetical protein